MISFEALDLIAPIQKALVTQGYTHPTPIQAQAIPYILEGKDLLGCAQTGTGKTAAFAIPILQLLEQQPKAPGQRRIKALIVTPTRELAIQIAESFEDYGKNLPLKTTVIFGGVNQKPQVDALRKGVDILVATPGRLLDLMQQKYISLKDINLFVLDEADRMLDMGFIHDVKRLIAALPREKQTLFFSATMPPVIQKLADEILHHPVKVAVTPESTTAETINQKVYMVDKNNKNDLLLHVLKDKAITSALVFTRTKHGADKVVKVLEKHHIGAAAIHGNKSQNARQKALDHFKTRQIRVLVATDIAARGIDIDELMYVVNFEIPNIPETYVHRIGRSGRAGAKGIALSFCDIDEVAFLKDIQKIIGKSIPEAEEHPYPMKNFTALPSEKKGKKAPVPRGHHKREKPAQVPSFSSATGRGSEAPSAKKPARSPQAVGRSANTHSPAFKRRREDFRGNSAD